MPKKFKGPKFPLSRSKYGQVARDAKQSKLNQVRGKEMTASKAPRGFDLAAKFARTKKVDPNG